MDEVPDDQEVVGEAHLLDRLQLVGEPFVQLGRDRFIALLQAFFAECEQVLEGVLAVGERELREQDVAECELDVAALGDLERAAHRVVVAGEVERHFLRRLEVEVVGVELPVVRVLQRVARLDAEQRFVCACVGVAEVVHVAGCDGGEPALRCELGELRQDALLDLQVRVLQLDVDVGLAEGVGEARELGLGVGGAVFLERAADAAGEAAGERDQAGAVAGEELPVDARLVVVALEVAERCEADQVAVAGVVGGEQGEVGVALRLGVAVVGDVDLAADDRLDACSLRRV